jgi:hypothetical protein
MGRERKLEQIEIPPESRVVKDWFDTREKAEAVVPAIHAHINVTGETHTCFCHTHTKPPADSIPVYIGEFAIPKKYRDVGRFCPCPCCWEDTAKFGKGKIAWFPLERVIRLMGDHCFRSLNAEGHETALRNYEIEQERRRNRNFLLSNVGRLPEAIAVIEQGIKVAKALEELHGLLHNRLRSIGLNLWPYARREGKLPIYVEEKEFRRRSDGEMYAHAVTDTQTLTTLPAFEMLDPSPPRITEALKRYLGRIRQLGFAADWESAIERMGDEERRRASDTLSRAVRSAKDQIAEVQRLRRFAEPVIINTLRTWGADERAPVRFHCERDGEFIRFAKSDARTVGLPVPPELQEDIGTISFWTELRRRGEREAEGE